MPQRVDVAIIGAGTAGLSAMRRVREQTGNFVLINAGQYGTTCARNGCMPSKALIEAANGYARARKLGTLGVRGSENLVVDPGAVLAHVRTLRDQYVQGVLELTHSLGERKVDGVARILGPNAVSVNGRHYTARAIIIATGSWPVVPDEWQALGDRLLTSDDLFEQPSLPPRLAVIGLGGVGLELAQALARLGVEVHGFEATGFVGGLTDPAVSEAAIAAFGREFSIHTGVHAGLSAYDGGVRVEAGERHVEVDKVLVALGRAPDSGALNLEALGLPLDDRGLPPFDTGTQQVGDLPVFIAGDVNGYRPLLHEAADEGYIAGCNAVHGQQQTFVRRTPLMICFSTPDIARAGASFASLNDRGIVTGTADFAGQGRARMSGRDQGRLRVYADAESGRLLGAEMCIPGGEHIAHLLAWSIQQRLALSDMLSMPYYHPTLEEGLRTALRAAGKQFRKAQPDAQARACDQLPVRGLD